MTNHWNDLANTDCALIIGSNAAENHPMSFKWLTKAREERKAKIICVDPRFTRTAARSDIHAPLRSGTDIAFIGGLINYAIQKNKFQRDYVVRYTNAAFIVDDGYDFKDGYFSGWDPQKKTYANATWNFKKDDQGNFLKDETLENPRCVFQLLKKHYNRYDADTVCKVTGTPKEVYLKVCEAYTGTGQPNKSGTIMYAMGCTQHTVGSQNVRSYAMLQLLLGNIGVPGGGVQAMRGESNVQGSTDFGLLFHMLPGYISSPQATPEYALLADYLKKETPASGYWVNKPKFFTSLLKAWWGDKATAENDFAYHYLPKRDPKKNYSHIALFEAMYKGEIKGCFVWGGNPVVGGPNARKEAAALGKLDWLVCMDLFETETANFWSKEAGADPKTINTEVFMLPVAASYEKAGSISNSGRWCQWRYKAVNPPGEARDDLMLLHELALRLKRAYASSDKPQDEPIKHLFWDFGNDPHHPDIEIVAKEISGYDWTTKTQLKTFGDLKDDGSTVSGCWVYGGMYNGPAKENNRARNRKTEKEGIGQHLDWAFAWPVNRRILYNRCSADYDGKPWSEDKKLLWWDGSKWGGLDVPDFVPTKAPSDPGGTDPYIMQAHGKGGLFAVMAEGPFPEHYEPWESPVNQQPFSKVLVNPVAKVFETEKGDNTKFPYVGTTYRVCEHWQTGVLTRNTPWLAELMPHMFVEISPTLAQAKGIKNGDQVVVSSLRGEIKCYVIVTGRFQPLMIDGKPVEQVGMPWHYGFLGLAKGSVANHLTPHVGDANTTIPEYKAFLCDIRRAN